MKPATCLFESVVEASKDGIIAIDKQGLIVVFNAAAERMFGRRRETMIGQSLDLLMPTAYRREHCSFVKGYFQNGKPDGAIGKTVELPALKSDGTTFPIELSLSAGVNDDGPLVLAVVRDVTLQKKRARALKESEHRLQTVLRAIPAGVVIIEASTHVIVDVNPAAADAIGLPREQILGHTCHRFICPAEEGQCPITDLGQSIDHSERSLVRADGTEMPILKTVVPLHLDGTEYLIGSFLDLSERKEMEQTLRQERDRAQKYLDVAGTMMVALDMEGKVTLANRKACDILSYPTEELIGIDWFGTFVSARDRDEVRAVFRAWMEGETQAPEHFENSILAEDGSERFIAWQNTVLRDRDGNICGTLSSGMDITERRHTEKRLAALVKQLENVNQELKDFAYIVSHDLKAPLRGIRTIADWLSADYADKLDGQGAEQLTLLSNRVNRMHDLIEGVLQYSRVGRADEQSQDVDLNELVDRAIDMVGIPRHITVSVDSHLPVVHGDPTRIVQVFQNLLSNAVKYMDKPEGCVRIGCSEEEGSWRFSVSDNGPGIARKHFEKIFQMFQTLAPKDTFESTGVGLTIVKRIVEKYNGRVWLESEPGVGSTFYFTLPQDAERTKDEKRPTCHVG